MQGFAPRRLGHANLFVGDLETSIGFYSAVGGIELVRREPTIRAAFHSNGNTHHDLGMLQCSGGVRIGIDGYVQPSSRRGHAPGLNHLGWEINSEADLVAAIERAEKAGVKAVSYANHQISHSIYVTDPDGNLHEFYADVVEDWREYFNLEREDLVSEQWNWAQSAKLPPRHPPEDERHVADALFHPKRITHCTLVVDQLDDTVDFLRGVGGLDLVASADGVAAVKGSMSRFDLLLVSAKFGQRKGLHGMSFVVDDPKSIAAGAAAAKAAGYEVTMVETPSRASAILRDPDGLFVEFYAGERQSILPDTAAAGRDELWAYAA
jgi:catechol 2,3-dioxygenase